MKKHQSIRPLLFALAVCGGGSAHAVSFTHEGITLDINGTVNGYYVNRQAKMTSLATGASTTTNDSALTNGLLPGWINFVMTTQAKGQDIKAHFSFAPGINNNSTVVGLPIGNNAGGAGNTDAFSQIDTRNVYFQFGNKDWGTLKFGRDIGLFGQNVILSDMTLLGVGGTSNAGIPYNTTFGMIGHGYMYTGFQPQITYTTPTFGGFQASAGIFQPSKFAGDETKSPGFQAMASYDFTGSVPGKLWAGMVAQDTDCSTRAACVGNKSFSASGYELGAKASFGNFEALAYTFAGRGLGLSTVGAQFFGGSDGAGDRTDSRGYFLQGTYKFGDTKVGLNYGQNKDKNGFVGITGGAGAQSPLNTIKNRAWTFGVYHSLNKFITLVGEFNQERIDNVADSHFDAKNRTISLGGIIFF
ncbi:MAG: porin [Azospira sp.]|jgi:predicted porin|nr:porin [Azospira sp.]